MRLHYVEWPAQSGGSAPRPPGQSIFALHGLSSNARFWLRVASHLGGRSFVALDQRSHGPSDRMRTGDTIARFVDDARRAIARLGLERPVLAGRSWGACIALELAARHPETASALGCIDGPAWPLSDTLTWPEFAARSQTTIPRHSNLAAAIDAARAWHGPLWGEDLVEFVRAGHRPVGDAVVLTLTYEARARILRDLFALHQDQAWRVLAIRPSPRSRSARATWSSPRQNEPRSTLRRSPQKYWSSGTTRRMTSRSRGREISRATSRHSDRPLTRQLRCLTRARRRPNTWR